MIDPKLGNLFMMSKVSKSPSVFLDRDGVLNKDIGYVHKPSQINWIPGAKEAVALLKNQGYLVFVVTNQSGIARGLYTEDEVDYLHAWMNTELLKSGGSSIDDFRYSPYHPAFENETYANFKNWRKPGPGMILDIITIMQMMAVNILLLGEDSILILIIGTQVDLLD